MPRKSIPKSLKNKVWDKYIGKKKGEGQCYCCAKTIDSKDFECGHVLAVCKGGTNTLENLRPICGCCNKSMGSQNLESFKTEYFHGPLEQVHQYVSKIENYIKIMDNIINSFNS